VDSEKIFESILLCIQQAQTHSNLLAENMSLIKDRLEEQASHIADLETIIDELPNLGSLFAAVQELQELHDAPASVFTHYISGGRTSE